MSTSPSPTVLYEQSHLSQDQTPRFVASTTAVVAIATICVVLRLVARKVQKSGYRADDLFIVLALVVAWGMFVANIFEAKNGQGRHLLALSPTEMTNYFKLLYATDAQYITAILLIQMSFLCFYHRVFTFQKPVFKWAVLGTGIFSVSVFISSLLVSLFGCLPISYNWDRSTPGHCVNTKDFFIANGVINLVNDLVIAILPVPMVWRLQIQRSEKIALSGIFLLGAFVCVGNVVRLPYLVSADPADLTWSLADGEIWAAAEICMGISSACLPCFRPYLLMFKRRIRAFATTGSISKKASSDGSDRSDSFPMKRTSASSTRQKRPFASLGSDAQSDKVTADDDLYDPAVAAYPGAIGVRHDVHVTSSNNV